MSKKYSKIWLSEDDYEKLRNCEKIKRRDLLLIEIEYGTAMRISEILNLKRQDLIKERGRTYAIIKEQKTDKKNWEKQPIPPDVFSNIIRYCDEKNIKDKEFPSTSIILSKISFLANFIYGSIDANVLCLAKVDTFLVPISFSNK